MENFILFFVIIFSGFLLKFPKEKKFNFFKSVLVVGLETIVGSVLFLMFLYLIMYTKLNDILITKADSLFSVVLLIAIINGIILYWINRVIIKKFKISPQVQTLCEYIIQWSLIYITVYQVIFDNLVKSANLLSNPQQALSNLDIANPADLMLLVLPSLISVWIGVIAYKALMDEI